MTTANPSPELERIRNFDDSTGEPTQRVLIVEDHELLAHGLSLALRLEGFKVRISRGPARADVLDAARDFEPDLVLLDYQLGGELGWGSALVAPLREGGAHVVMVSGTMTPRSLAECVEVGCEGFVDKSRPFEELLDAVFAATRGQTLLTPSERTELLLILRRERADEAARQEVLDRLTAREAEVLSALIEGRSAERIAAEAFVSPTTVRSQIRSILQKLGCNSQLAAVALARELGWTGREAVSR